MTDIPVFITARMGSERFPGKHLKKIYGKPIIEHMIGRIRHAKLPQYFVLCTTTSPEDDIFEDITKNCDIKLFRGDKIDILKRWLNAAEFFKIKYFVSTEADDIFCDPTYIDKIIQILLSDKYDYISCKGLPFGVSPTGIKVDALQKICSIKKEKDTEGQERYFTKTNLFNVYYIENYDPKLMNSDVRMTLDYPEDYEFFLTVYSYLYDNEKYFSLLDILELLNKHPEIIDINKKMQEEYEKRYNEKYGKIDLLHFKD